MLARSHFLLATLLLLLVSSTALAKPPHGFVGVNCAIWDSNLDTLKTIKLLSDAGITALRWPGGSTSDDYDWTKSWGTTTAQFADVAEKLHAVVTITTNYGSGTPQMAAAWVAYCNAQPSSRVVIGRDTAERDWKTAGFWAEVRSSEPLPHDDGYNRLRIAQKAPYGFTNWEIGNECYGSWEKDLHSPKHDPVVYAQFALAAAHLMRAVDSKVRIGIVVTAGQPYPSQESVVDPATRQPTSEWTPIVLSTLSTHGFRPDFIALHHYAQNSGEESDAKLFADVQQWPLMIGSLRKQLTAFYPKQDAKIGIACTESNSVSFNPGPQTTGDANARYYAQVAPVALSLGVENLIWWNLHNGQSTSGHDTHSPLNRYSYGDYGILAPDAGDKPYPVYYAIKTFATGKHPRQ